MSWYFFCRYIINNNYKNNMVVNRACHLKMEGHSKSQRQYGVIGVG